MDRFGRITAAALTAPEYPRCRGEGCRNDHLDADGFCAECAAEMHVELALDADADVVLAGFETGDESFFVRALDEETVEALAAITHIQPSNDELDAVCA